MVSHTGLILVPGDVASPPACHTGIYAKADTISFDINPLLPVEAKPLLHTTTFLFLILFNSTPRVYSRVYFRVYLFPRNSVDNIDSVLCDVEQIFSPAVAHTKM